MLGHKNALIQLTFAHITSSITSQHPRLLQLQLQLQPLTLSLDFLPLSQSNHSKAFLHIPSFPLWQCRSSPNSLLLQSLKSHHFLLRYSTSSICEFKRGELTDVESEEAKMSETEVSRARPPLVPLGTLIGRELRSENVEKPVIRYGQAALAKKGEDYFLIKPDCQRIPGNPSTSFSVFAIFDGHNGISAAIFAKETLLNNVLSAVPEGASREEWLQALPRALVAGFVKTDIEFQQKGESSGTTVTFVVIDGWTVTVASVGDSRCILDTQGGVVSDLTVDHRLEENEEERARVTASGGEVGRLNVFGGNEVGPLRCWPGGLCLSRSIGDTDVGEFIVPVPHVKQVKLSDAGGRLIIASDGIWDALSSDAAAKACRGLPADLAAKLVVKEALRSRGLKDDTTCLVVDIIPSVHPILPPTPQKKHHGLSGLLFGKKSHNLASKSSKLSAVGAVEELFEEGSAMLAERLGKDFPMNPDSGLFRCAICQVDHPANEGLSLNSGTFFSPSSKPWEGPFLCANCRRKKDAMEGKRPLKPTISI